MCPLAFAAESSPHVTIKRGSRMEHTLKHGHSDAPRMVHFVSGGRIYPISPQSWERVRESLQPCQVDRDAARREFKSPLSGAVATMRSQNSYLLDEIGLRS